MRKNRNLAVALALVLILSLVCFTGCGSTEASAESGGVLKLKVNPEIAILYDDAGVVTGLEARNKDAKAILDGYTGFEGKETKEVVLELVDRIADAGYFVEEIEGEVRHIEIEIEAGSKLPSDVFLDDIVKDIKTKITASGLKSPLDVINETDYGMTDFVDTDYGVDNDGDTDYTNYGPDNDGVTDYSDYGTANKNTNVAQPSKPAASTDYDDTDYGPNNDGVTDYDDTDYGPNNDGVTDFNENETPYDNKTDYDDKNTDYDDKDDKDSNYGDSAYDD